MAIRDQLNADLRDALRAGNEVRKVAIRGLLTAIRYAEIEAGKEFDDAAILGVVAREIRQRRDSAAEYDKAGRTDLVAKEEAEIAALAPYLPPQLSREDIASAARGVIERVGAKGPADKGKVMPVIMSELRGQADGRDINAVVTELLSAEA
jgi:uncharacterized protein YqeY